MNNLVVLWCHSREFETTRSRADNKTTKLLLSGRTQGSADEWWAMVDFFSTFRSRDNPAPPKVATVHAFHVTEHQRLIMRGKIAGLAR